jgi:hypothetical protein
MKHTINSYFAILIVTVVGAGATSILTRVAEADIAQYDFMIKELSEYSAHYIGDTR